MLEEIARLKAEADAMIAYATLEAAYKTGDLLRQERTKHPRTFRAWLTEACETYKGCIPAKSQAYDCIAFADWFDDNFPAAGHDEEWWADAPLPFDSIRGFKRHLAPPKKATEPDLDADKRPIDQRVAWGCTRAGSAPLDVLRSWVLGCLREKKDKKLLDYMWKHRADTAAEADGCEVVDEQNIPNPEPRPEPKAEPKPKSKAKKAPKRCGTEVLTGFMVIPADDGSGPLILDKGEPHLGRVLVATGRPYKHKGTPGRLYTSPDDPEEGHWVPNGQSEPSIEELFLKLSRNTR